MKLYLGRNPLRLGEGAVEGGRVEIDGEDFYRISHFDRLRPFFMSIVSASDQWMFISSTGALTAGRGNPDVALFPYYTDDKIHDSAEITGGKTIIIAQDRVWEPLSERGRGIYRVQRNLYKSFCGNKLIFEENNLDLGLNFRYGWFNSDQFGFVRRTWLKNYGGKSVRVRILDGIQNILPAGLGSQLQLEKSTLVDAYKKNELMPETGLALFTLSSIPVDRPEPAEALRATTVWSSGLHRSRKLISSTQLERFRRGEKIQQEVDLRAARGAYFIESEIPLRAGETASWMMVAEVNQGPSEVAELNARLRKPKTLERDVAADIERGTEDLKQIVALADGLQKTAEPLRDARHFNNVLCNVMRGGVFLDGYKIDEADFKRFATQADRRKTPLRAAILERLRGEYLPLAFSRRHGDPSRPWNRFSIAARNADGSRMLNYEGNWRDIFQNWEALAVSFPGYVGGMISKFANASTLDGYNPYRVTRDGLDWEVVDPHDPWSHIGYWGDHQLIYLLKLLEILQRHEPALLRHFLHRPLFAYANVPYRIAPYDQLLKDAKETVHFDAAVEQLVRERVQERGADGKLVWDTQQEVTQVNLTEKILVSVLAKLSNFVPEAGIWLNTQRPEWNDANNALVGGGASVVTLHYLRRYLAFCVSVLANEEVELSSEVADFLAEITRILDAPPPSASMSDRQRRTMIDKLGRAGSNYRTRIYAKGLSGKTARLTGSTLRKFFTAALEWVDHSIQANRRPDGLHHAYNLISFAPGTVAIRGLYEMLEGQVAALSSGCLSAEESLAVLRALKKSSLYRADQHSYLLYPDRALPRFTDKNNIPPREIKHSKLLQKLMADGNRTLVEKDKLGGFHFNGALSGTRDVNATLDRLETRYGGLVRKERALVVEIFERLFDHQSFTGRSGTFFGYEGLGCIYWHMVSKLLLAAQETYFRAVESGAPRKCAEALAQCYYDIREGIGDCKSPAVYGAFPMDPYSHTPGQGGARQPGLTGQVKEDILCRWGELGLTVRDGQIHFQPRLLRRGEFLEGKLSFTYCQTPVEYQLSDSNAVTVWRQGKPARNEGLVLDTATSRAIFQRTGEVQRVVVSIALC